MSISRRWLQGYLDLNLAAIRGARRRRPKRELPLLDTTRLAPRISWSYGIICDAHKHILTLTLAEICLRRDWRDERYVRR